MILRIRDTEGNVQEILALKGDDYVLTEKDKAEIALILMEMITPMKTSQLVNDAGYLTEEQVNALINAALGGSQAS